MKNLEDKRDDKDERMLKKIRIRWVNKFGYISLFCLLINFVILSCVNSSILCLHRYRRITVVLVRSWDNFGGVRKGRVKITTLVLLLNVVQ